MIQRVWDCVYHTDKYGTPFYHEFAFGDDIYHLVCRCTLRLSHLLITTMQLICKVYSWRNLFGAGALDAFGHFFQNDPKFNKIKKHVANSTPERGASSGGIVTQEAPIHVSNVMLVDEEGTPTRVGYRFDEDGKKVRISRRTGKDI